MSAQNRAETNGPYGQGSSVAPSNQAKIVNSRVSLRSRRGAEFLEAQLRFCVANLKQKIAASKSGAVPRDAVGHLDSGPSIVCPRPRYSLNRPRASMKWPRALMKREEWSGRRGSR